MRYIRQYTKQPEPVKWKYFDTTRGVSVRDGSGDAVVGVVRLDRAGLSEGRQRPTANWLGADVAYLLPAELVQYLAEARIWRKPEQLSGKSQNNKGELR